ncbi:MAG: hypothetical protein KKA05_07770 [Alphaproteobacteria bacterium]|nr:hypothetical protein [Alphaproteobacteria bacterium]
MRTSVTIKDTLKLKAAFAALVLCSFAVAGNAQAADRADIQKVTFTEVKDNAQTRKSYPFLHDVWQQLETIKEKAGLTKVYVSEVKEGPLKNSFLMRAEGPFYCGLSNCTFRAYTKTDDGYKELLNISTTDQIYLQNCTDEVSLIFLDASDASKVGKWDYKTDEFAFKGVYAGLDKVPACAVKN